MGWLVRYNGFGTEPSDPELESGWYHLTIDAYAAQPQYADDGVSRRATRHVLRGTALIRETTEAAFFAKWREAEEAFGAVGKSLQISSDAYSTGDDYLVDFDADNDPPFSIGFPRGEINITRVAGQLSAFVGFTLEWETPPVAVASPESSILAHWWTQSWDHDEAGYLKWTVSGQLVVALDGTLGSAPAFETNPDAFRELIYPTLPPNFRHESSQYAVSPQGDALIYSITAAEHARPLPAPARVGRGSFVWRRDATSAGGALLGIKMFDVELEGDPQAGRNDLLAAAVRCSVNRIVWGGPGADRILSVEVQENDIFSRNSIRLAVVAQAIGSAVPFSMRNPSTNQPIDIGTPLVGALDGLTAGFRPNAYGAALVRGVRRAIVGTYEAPTKAEYESVDQSSEEIYSYVDAGVGTILPPIPVGDETEFIQRDHGAASYLRVTAKEHVSVDDRRHLFVPIDPSASAIPVQRTAPVVRIFSRVTIVRLKVAPERVMMAVPSGGMVTHENWAVEVGTVDANNNRVFVAVYEREVVLSKANANAAVFVTRSVNVPGVGEVEFTAFEPESLALPGDPRTESSSSIRSRNIFGVHPRSNGTTIFDHVLRLDLEAEYGLAASNP